MYAQSKCVVRVFLGAAIAWIGSASTVQAAFLTPGSWTPGDTSTTYQEWSHFTAADTTPDAGYLTSPAITTEPDLVPVAPGFTTGSGNFYSFSGNYGFTAEIYNHGGSAGTGGLPAGSGTHVIVQTAATLNGTTGVFSNTLEVVDLLGNPLSGGSNSNALSHGVIFEGIVSSTFGDVLIREEIWEFFLPGYTGDFKIQADVIVHSSFQGIRVDSAVSPSAFAVTAVPEPMTMALLGLGGSYVVSRRRRKKLRQ